MFHWSELRGWYATRRNLVPATRVPQEQFWSLFHGPASAPATLEQAARSATELLVVLTTYNRPGACASLLQQLARTLEHANVQRAHVLVINDAAEADYDEVRALARQLFGSSTTWLDARARLGKPGFWKSFQTAFLAAEMLQPANALFLQDDLELPVDMLRRVQTLWQRTSGDAARRVLYLFACHDDEPHGRWVQFPRRPGPLGLRMTQWFDLSAFYVDLAFFELLRFQMIEIHPNRWRRKPSTSSGVGRQLTLRLFGRANIYQAHPTLVLHGALPSEMNPEARAKRSFDNRKAEALPSTPVGWSANGKELVHAP